MTLARAVAARPQRWRPASVFTVGALLASIVASTVPPAASVAAAGTALQLASASWVPGFAAPASNVALQLNGTSQYGTVGTTSQLRSPTFTLELWFRRTGAGIASTSGTGNGGIPDPIPLITKGRAEAETAAADINYFLGIDASSGELVADFEEARIAQGGTDEGLNHPVLGTTPIVPDAAWHHAAATYDGTTWNLYLDGVLDGSAFIDRPAAALTNVPTTVGSALTTTAGTGASGFFAGVVDEVRIWNFARSVAEINATKDVQITSAETGLLGAWNMNTGNGTILADSTGNIATGGLVGAPGAEYATLGTTTQLRSPTFTVELWFSRTAAGAPSATGTGTGGIARPIPLITKGRAEAETAAADVNYLLGIDFDTGTLVADFEEAQIAQGGTTPGLNHPITGTGVIAADGAWHHAAATYDGATWNLFLDGILDGTLAVGRAANAANTVPTAVGTALTTASAASGFFAGVVDEVRIWSVARTLAQINATKDIEITSAQPNLMGVWNLNAGTGTSLADSSGNGIVGAAVNTPAWVPGFEAPLPGSVPPTIALDAPANGATGIGTSPSLRVSVADANGDSLKVSFFGRPAASGNFALLGTNSGVTSGTVSSITWSGINDAQKFEWFATVTDSHYLVTGPTWTFTTADGPGTVFVGAGDIADCARTQDEATAAVIDGIAGQIWTSGDNVYNSGTATEFANCYDASWGGDIKARTRPAPGNHDWGTGNLNGYNGYFGAAATDAGGKSYYSYDADSNWHIVVLDSECAKVVGGCGAASAQVAWMRADLAANSTKNVVVIWHKPRYSSSTTNLVDVQPFLDVSHELGVDVVLVGHDHVYERMAPMDPAGLVDATRGVRMFTVGTGGAAVSGFSTLHPRSVARNNTVYGVLRLTLHATSYDWKFFPIAGQMFADAGSSPVHGRPPSAEQAPDPPTVNTPANGATGIGPSPTLDVDVSDPNGDPMTVTFLGRPLASGNFTQIGQSLNVPSGTNATAAWVGLGAGQEYEWYVTVDDETGTPVTTGPTWQFHTVASPDPVFVGTGDIASCAAGVTEDTETGNLIRGIDGFIWTSGDNVYPNGTAAEFANCYETTPWGDASVQSRTRPVSGNHDWGTGATENLNGYFGYYGANANAGGTSYYSYDVDANWHIVNLDSECQLVPGGCDVGSPQEVWLRADLATNADQNVIAIWHKPRYSTGTTNYQAMAPLWDAIYDAGVDILLDGHDHIYERTAPMRAGATLSSPPVLDPTYGIRQFTVGTGGEAHHGLTTNVLPTSQVRDDQTFGVLKLTLHATTYDWVFLPIAGSTFTDSGTGTVHDAPDTTAPPPVPTINSGPPDPSTVTTASFTFSDTEAGVTFECALDAAAFAACTSPRNYSGLAAGEHSFGVRARDAAGNLSSAATHAWTIELPTTVTTTLRAIADSYTDASSPTTNYGSNVKLRVDGSPVVRSYLRFDLSSIPGTISSATLRIWALSSQSAGWTARSVTGAWTELGINSNNAPTLGTASFGSSGPVTTGTWTSVNVTALVGTGTTLDIGINTASTTALSLSSDESGAATAPQLVVISGGGPPPGDTEDPTMPGNLQATAPLATQVHLTWTASTDNVGVTGYTIYRNGAFATTVGGTATSWDDNGRTPSTTYSYAIEAFDAAGNISPRTAPVSITTPAGGTTTTTTLRSIADSYVDAANAGTNYGTNLKLRVDGSPAVRTYVRFDLSSLSGTITRATLRMWATSSQSSGWQARSVNGAWAELTLTSSNAPSLGAVIGSSGAVSAGTWTVVDVTALLSGGTTLNIGLTTTSTTALAMSSRETGTTTAPQLVVETTN